MKRLLGIATAILLSFNMQAQSVNEGIKLLNYERFESAEKALTSLAANDAEANYYLGLALLGQEKLNEAKAVFQKYPNDFYNQAGMARVLFKEGKRSEAMAELNKITDKAKKKEWEKYKVAADAITYTQGGEVQTAIEWYNKALERNNDANTRLALGDAYLKLKSGGGEAMNNFEKATELDPNNSLAFSRIGSVWYDAHRYDLALESYNKAKETDPNNPLPYKELAQAYRSAGKYENSLKNIEEYLSKSDQSINDQITYANLLYLAEKYDLALTKMEDLLAKGVEKPYMYRIIAYSAYETKDYDKALSNLNIFFKKETNPANWVKDDYLYGGKIMLSEAQKNEEEAQKYIDSANYYFNTLVTKDTVADKTELYRDIADNFKDAKEYKSAGVWYGKIIAANEEASPLDYFYWGYWNFYGEDYAKAAEAFDKMIAKYPDEGSGYFWRARVAAAQDAEVKTGAAVPYFEKWLNFQNKAEDYVRQPNDLKLAYQYLAYYYYNQKDKTNSMKWVNKILEINPEDEWGLSIKKYFDALK